MSVKVYTYTDLKDLRKLSYYEEIRNLPHITATANLAGGMQHTYPDFSNVLSMDDIMQKLIPFWVDSSVVFQQYLVLGRIIRDYKCSEKEKNICAAFKKSKRDVLSSIRFLMAAGVDPDDLTPDCLEQQVFKSVWIDFEYETETFCPLRQEMDVLTENPEIMTELLEKEWPFFSTDRVVLHGFFQINPVQQRIIDTLENAGKEIIYLCCIDPEVHKTHEIWENTFETEFGFPSKEEWISGDSRHCRNYYFGKLFDSGESCGDENYSNIRIIRYKTETEFIKDIERIKSSGLNLYSADCHAANEMLKSYYPEYFRKRHLLSYPVGQYIFKLHSMWDANGQCIRMEYDDVRCCFASGWLIAEKINGKKYLNALEAAKPYFEKCETPEEWLEAVYILKNARAAVSEAFESSLNDVPIEHAHEHAMMANPFRNFSCFSISDADIAAIERLLMALVQTAEALFSESGEVRIEKHLRTLRMMLGARPDPMDVYKEESAVVDELMSKISMGHLTVDTCFADDMTEAIMFIIGGGILNEDELIFTAGQDETLIRQFIKISSAPITASHGIHLCLATENNLPGRIGAYSWPLSEQMLIKIEERAQGRKKLYIHEMRNMATSGPQLKRYLFYSMLQNDKVEISWIENEGDREILPSPYIRLLEDVFAVSQTDWGHETVDVSRHTESYERRPQTLRISEESLLTKEIRMDTVLCRWRYIYGYILEYQPKYRDGFHYDFLISRLAGTFSSITGVPKETVTKKLFELIPYYMEIEKQQAEDYASSNADIDTDGLGDVSYPTSRLLPHFLSKSVVALAKEMYEGHLEKKDTETRTFHNSISSDEKVSMYEVCMYCPFGEDCPHAVREEEK